MVNSLRRARDSQRIRVYRANSVVLGTPLPHMEDVRLFCNRVISSSLWQKLFPSQTAWKVPPLKPGKGARSAHVLWYDDGRIEIAFPRAYRYATYVLHELAHYGIGYREDIAAHGPEFTGIWLTLVREFCSTRTSHALEKAIAREKVKMFIPIIGMTITPETNNLKIKEVTKKPVKKIDQLSLF